MPNINNIHHIAIATDDIEKSLSFWRDALGLGVTELCEVSAEKSKVAFLPIKDNEIELVCPTTDDSGIARFLAKRGPGLHHICLEVEDLELMLTQLKSMGIRLINETPLITSEGKQYVFIHPESTNGVLVELYE